jgi:hypothetical protein
MKNQYQGLIQTQNENIAVERNRTRSLRQITKGLQEENDELATLVQDLESRPPEIKYVTRTETVVVSEKGPETLSELPEEYLFKVGEKLVVARFAQEEGEYVFETYDLTFVNAVLIGETETSSIVSVSTSFDPELKEEFKPELKVTRVRDQKLFTPHLGVGITGSVPTPELSASLYASFIHPNENLDLLSLRVGGNSQAFRVGVDPVGYNIGSKLPVVQDLWIYGGAGLSTQTGFNADITIGTKF